MHHYRNSITKLTLPLITEVLASIARTRFDNSTRIESQAAREQKMTSVIRAVPASVMKCNEGRTQVCARKGEPHDEIHGSRSVAGGGDVGTERAKH
jgi:hypothetical protein